MRMNKNELERYTRLINATDALGLSRPEVHALLKCERTLTRWACAECGNGSNWAIEREELPDGEEGRPFRVYHGPDRDYSKPAMKYAIPDLERGALRRAQAIAAAHGLTVYRQGDPRGCALYLIRPGDIPAGCDLGAYYNRGLALCV